MKKKYVKLIVLLLLFQSVSCVNGNEKDKKSSAVTKKEIIINSIPNDYKYYFKTPLSIIRKLSWKNVVITKTGDEYSTWIQVKLYLSNAEWIDLETNDTKTALPASLETNSNYFLKKTNIKIGDKIEDHIMDSGMDFSFDDGPALSNNFIDVKSDDCLTKISLLDWDKVTIAKRKGNKDMLPEVIKNCRVTSVRFVNILNK